MNFIIKFNIKTSSISVKDQNKEFIIDNFDSFSESNILFYGDPIFINNKKNISNPNWVIRNVKGHYRFVIIEKNNFFVGSSAFNILPVYYIEKSEFVYISDSINELQKLVNEDINIRFFLETILFNYQLFNLTQFKNILRLDTNSYIKLSEKGLDIIKSFQIEDFYSKSLVPWRKSVNDTSEYFIDIFKHYIPLEETAISLTGGFDGRTLVALGKYYNKEFRTFSFGSNYSSDLRSAERISNNIENVFFKILLEDDYLKKSLSYGIDFILNSEGNASFTRAHYLYASDYLKNKKNIKYILTGNFGSEIFRALHTEGAMINKNLINIYKSNNILEFIKRTVNTNIFQLLNLNHFKSEIESIYADIDRVFFDPHKINELSLNERFYTFVFEEVFRKYFGPELINQNIHLINRTPFLDLDFILRILQTQLSGVYSDFYTDNPFKRLKGQMVYSKILKETNLQLYREPTDKGYKPSDLNTLIGKFQIAKSYLHKRIKQKTKNEDYFSVRKSFERNKSVWQNYMCKNSMFRIKKIESLSKLQFNEMAHLLSQIFYNSTINDEN